MHIIPNNQYEKKNQNVKFIVYIDFLNIVKGVISIFKIKKKIQNTQQYTIRTQYSNKHQLKKINNNQQQQL